MKKITLLLFFIFGATMAAQEPTRSNDTVAKKSSFTKVSQTKPMYPGGMKAFHAYLQEKLAPLGFVSGLEGKMIITFIVEKDGSVTNVKMRQGIEKELNLAVMKVLKEGPRWIPAKQNGALIRAQYTLPITF